MAEEAAFRQYKYLQITHLELKFIDQLPLLAPGPSSFDPSILRLLGLLACYQNGINPLRTMSTCPRHFIWSIKINKILNRDLPPPFSVDILPLSLRTNLAHSCFILLQVLAVLLLKAFPHLFFHFNYYLFLFFTTFSSSIFIYSFLFYELNEDFVRSG